MSFLCPVCAYPNLYGPPHNAEGGGSDEICPYCGFQFGYDDDSELIRYSEWREKWIALGSKWFSNGRPPPENWDPARQQQNLPPTIFTIGTCPVCGFPELGSQDMCPRCKYQFDGHDTTARRIEWRRAWCHGFTSYQLEWKQLRSVLYS
jgi:hypothetical protein